LSSLAPSLFVSPRLRTLTSPYAPRRLSSCESVHVRRSAMFVCVVLIRVCRTP
jgi:hypothetical protein